VDPNTGVLSLLTNVAPMLTTDSVGISPLATPSGKFLYIQAFDQSGGAVNAIYCFSIAGIHGELTSLPGSPFIANNPTDPSLVIGLTPNGMVMDGQGRFFYLSDYDGTNGDLQATNAIRAYTINSTTGALQNGPILTSTSVAWLAVQAIDPASKYLYAMTLLSSSIAISVYAIDPTTLELTEVPGSPYPVINTPEGSEYSLKLFATPAGKFVYAFVNGSPGGLEVLAFSVDPGSGELTQVPGSPFTFGSPLGQALLHPSGKFVYVPTGADPEDAQMSVYPVDTTTGAIATMPVSSAPIDGDDGIVLFDPSGQIMVINDSTDTALSFTVGLSSGALTAATGSPFSVAQGWQSAVIATLPEN
jgi:6-phosphogluconolactonase (cycloisomerase 2 family)